MARKQSFRAFIFIALSLLGLLSAAILVKRTLELRRQAAYGTVSLSLQPSPVSICLNDQVYKIYLKLNPSSFNVGAAELSFAFDESKVEITSVAFHSAYLASIYNQASGRLNLTVLSTAVEVPNAEVFDLAVIEVKGKSAGSFDLDLVSYNIKGTRGSGDPTLDRDLNLANPDQVLTSVNVSVCGQGGGAMVTFSPASQTVNPGQETAVNVDIADVAGLYGFQFDVSYQESVLDYLSWSKGDFMTSAGDANEPFWTSPKISDGLIGSIAVTRLNPDPPRDGSGTLLRLTFRGGTGGSSLLTVENAKFLDRNGNQIPVILTGGQIDIYRSDVTATPTSQPTPTTEPAPTTRPTPTGQPSAEARLFLESDIDPTVDYFVTTVMIDTDGGKAMAVDAFLLFDAIMIEVRGVTVGSSFGSLKYNSSEPGSLKIYAYSQNPSATHKGVGDVARVVFGIRQEGRTRIDFDCDPDRDGDSAIWTTLAENLIDCQATEGADYDLQLPVIPLDAARVNFAIKMRGTSYQVGGQTIVVEDVPNLAVRVVVKSGAHQETFDNVLVNFDSQAVGRGSVALTQPVTSGDYVVLIKGPVHLARRFCENNQEGHCWLGEENITLHSGENYFNWTGVELEPGDINGDGVVDSIDFSQLKSAIGQQGSGIQQDLNFNKRVDTQDLVFFLNTLSNRYEDQL